MNLADLVFAAILLGIAGIGFSRGLVGIALYSLAVVLSLVAGVAVTLASAATPVPDAWLLVLVPVAFFLTFGIVLALLRSLASKVTRLWHKLPIAPADHLLGAVLAAVIGVLMLSLVVLAMLRLPLPNAASRAVAQGRAAPLLLTAGAQGMEILARPLPVLAPLAERLASARDEVLGGEATQPRVNEI